MDLTTSPATLDADQHRRMGRAIGRAFPGLDEYECLDAVTDAFLALHTRFEAAILPTGLFHAAAWRRARDMINSDIARRRREAAWALEVYSQLHDRARLSAGDFGSLCERVCSLLPDEDCRLIFPLWLNNERATAAYARALGLNGASEEEQKRIVKRTKDRMLKCLARSPEVRKAAHRFRL